MNYDLARICAGKVCTSFPSCLFSAVVGQLHVCGSHSYSEHMVRFMPYSGWLQNMIYFYFSLLGTHFYLEIKINRRVFEEKRQAGEVPEVRNDQTQITEETKAVWYHTPFWKKLSSNSYLDPSSRRKYELLLVTYFEIRSHYVASWGLCRPV